MQSVNEETKAGSKGLSICAVLTVFNRKEKTLRALEEFFSQEESFSLSAVLMDDGSSDGTAESVAERFPMVRVLLGDGTLFWNRGMARALQEAYRTGADFYLWLNDDTHLFPGVLRRLVADAESAYSDKGCIVVGSTVDPHSGKLTYGGKRRTSSWNPSQYVTIEPKQEEMTPCDSMNGNVVLVSAKAAEVLGGLDERFSHGMGDYDYGFRAGKAGVPLFVGRGVHGECPRNPPGSSWYEAGSIRERWRRMNSPKGLPMKEWAWFMQKHGNFMWPLTWIATYRRILTG